MLDHIASELVAHLLGVPVGSTQQVLYAIGRGVSRHLGQLPRVLPLGWRKQTAQIVVRPASNLAAREMRGDPSVESIQLLGPRAHRFSIYRLWHHASAISDEEMMPNTLAIYNCSISPPNKTVYRVT